MISGKLIKELEKEGFILEFPSYEFNDEKIIDILKEGNLRLNLAIPLLLRYDFDYNNIIKKLKQKKLKDEFNKLILISNKIFISEHINNALLKNIIRKNKITAKFSKSELMYYYNSFKEFQKNKETKKEEVFEENLIMRGKLNTNKALSEIFSPGKQRIMDKIFNHEPLSNTELKYYYRSIKPLILSILNENLRKYVRIIESTKKYTK